MIGSCPKFMFLTATGFPLLVQFSHSILVHHVRYQRLMCSIACVLKGGYNSYDKTWP